MPEELPDRTEGCMEPDVCSYELAQAIRQAFLDLTEGGSGEPRSAPALVALNLDRRKLDANRARGPSAGAEPNRRVWDSYHGSVASALEACVAAHGVALLIDIHGQSHRAATEIGYLLTSDDLLRDDAALDANQPRPSSLDALQRHAAGAAGVAPSVSAAVRGPSSIGAAIERAGFGCTPSPQQPQPSAGSATYFWGAYTTRRYGAGATLPRNANALEGAWASRVAVAQLEAAYDVRTDPAKRTAFATAVCEGLRSLLSAHGAAL